MDYTTFTMELMELLQKMIEEDTEIRLEKVPKNNGIVLDGIIFLKKGCRTSPVLYVQDYYEFWKMGISMEQLVEKIIWSFEQYENDMQIPQDYFLDYEKLRPRIFFKMISYQKNEELLKEIPHRRILDLAMVFYHHPEHVPATVLIQNNHLRMWGISEELLELDARKNTYVCLPAEFVPMREVVGPQGENSPMYVITNEERRFGAGVIFYPGVLEEAARLFRKDFFIIPSSIHECILMPDDGKSSQEELCCLVEEINEYCVDPREVLSDRAYSYRLKDGCIHL
ncbi:MAG: DUF5688 family protein [Ruminococcus sp.]|nr:DUF5688 family protein [Ruminococcus sp.]